MKAIDDFFRGFDELMRNLTKGIERNVEEFSKAAPGETVERTSEESVTTHPSGFVTRTVKTIIVKRVRIEKE